MLLGQVGPKFKKNRPSARHPGGRIHEYRPHGIELWTLKERKEEGREKANEEEY